MNSTDYRICLVFFVAAPVLMATLLLKAAPGFTPYLFLATPYAFLAAFWIGFKGVAKRSGALESTLTEEGRVAFSGLQASILRQTIVGISAIAVSLAAGWTLGHQAASPLRQGAQAAQAGPQKLSSAPVLASNSHGG